MEYSIKDVSMMTGMKVRTIRLWIKNGKIKAKKNPDSMRWEITQEEIDRIISRRNVGYADKYQ